MQKLKYLLIFSFFFNGTQLSSHPLINKKGNRENHRCIYDAKKINVESPNEKYAIQKIKSQYDRIEKSLSEYTQYALFKDKDDKPKLVHTSLIVEDFDGIEPFSYGNNELFPNDNPVAFYFDKNEDLVYVEEYSGSTIAISGGGSSVQKYYFKPGAQYPFFIYTYNNSYSKIFEYDNFEDEEVVYEKEEFNENRIYIEMNSTTTSECPDIIRVLNKYYLVDEKKPLEIYDGNSEVYLKNFRKKTNKNINPSNLHKVLNTYIFDNILFEFAKVKKIKP